MNTAMLTVSSEEEFEVRRGPWTLEEDTLLIHYVACHGEGRWNLVAKFAGLNRSGKSCRLRWLNYLKPDIKRGNLSPQEQLLILELHSKWGNRWSKIARHLPGRTDNEIKNYWRTRVQKQARQLRIESNSNRFLEAIRRCWMPRLLEQVEQTSPSSSTTTPPPPSAIETQKCATTPLLPNSQAAVALLPPPRPNKKPESVDQPHKNPSSMAGSAIWFSDSMRATQLPETSKHPGVEGSDHTFGGSAHNSSILNNCSYVDITVYNAMEGSTLAPMSAVGPEGFLNGQVARSDWISDYDMAASLWNTDELWQI